MSEDVMGTVMEENEDLKQQNILLEQKLSAAERQIKSLEKLLVGEEKQISPARNGRTVNTATQVIIFIYG